MPVITLYYNRLQSLLKKKISREDLTDSLPYLGLDIEEETDDYVRIEYNPNRPDFSSEWGIARALSGLLGLERGLPKYIISDPNIKIKANESVTNIRPFFVGAVIRDLILDNDSISQIMVMQDDLDNGIGRRRSKVSTGLHDLDTVTPPFEYKAMSPEFKFKPLGYRKEMKMSEILKNCETGQNYGHIVNSFKSYPIILDKDGQVLSFPPIINGETTRVSEETRNLFIDITSTNMKAAEDVLAVLVAAFSDLGGKLEAIEVKYQNYIRNTPDLTPQEMSIDPSVTNKLLGLDLNISEIIECLQKSRISGVQNNESVLVQIPRYRSDILHPVDIIEEVALGFNIGNITPTLPTTSAVGSRNERLVTLDSIREVLIGLGLIEVINFSLISRELLNKTLELGLRNILQVENPKSSENEILRGSLIPSIVNTFGRNIHEQYPQKIFEIGKTFNYNGYREEAVSEDYRLVVGIAHSNTNYTEIKSYLTSFLKTLMGLEFEILPREINILIPGRSAEILIDGKMIGIIGELSPEILVTMNLRVPISIFEVNLELL